MLLRAPCAQCRVELVMRFESIRENPCFGLFNEYEYKATSERKLARCIVEKVLKAIARIGLPSPFELILNHGPEMWNSGTPECGQVHLV